MRNRISGLMHTWEQVGIEHAPTGSEDAEQTRSLRDPIAVAAVVALLGVALVLTVRALLGRSDR